MTKNEAIPRWDQVEILADMRFGDLVGRRQLAKQKEEEWATQRKGHDEEIAAYLIAAGVQKVEWNNEPVQYIESHSAGRLDRTILQNELVMAGVDADVVKRCTDAAWKVGKPYTYVSVGNKGDASKREGKGEPHG